MANIKSQKKRIITNEKARMRNRAIRSELKTATRAVKDAVAAQDGPKAIEAAHYACKMMDRAVSKGVIHKNQAANRKSGIMKLANTVATEEDRKNYKAPEKKAPVAKGGTKKAAAKAAKIAALEEAAKIKEKNRKATQKAEAAAAKKKAEAAAAEEAAEAEESAE
ncbi:MAG: 30S ribosomal protein S20 [Eggerthellaceae bacterium]|uniref:Small ribosomal subunit protein bS20 n=1 Tax=Denitrobacterium detoxificans TaxID=79604 RepID=A0A172RYP3_9ACTN|nr:30S ribosomal protein S20 [Denitrobacterium detoxificans]ANE22743.1 30S ribosomal protein S20 [Denitrobacterium detoxificans]MBE6466074.1 30S ribosomal protein S20 [Denitrobacterium detoxificans]MCR5583472.1 30S ribosomal protein S20 [Eggerthellaceae bacterium]SEO77995.1 SSU ribosomal protein S20P [Denitrobacterium detoxificans]